MSSPDVRVRLTPQGVREVTDALRRVQNEGRKANRQSAKGLGLVGRAVKDLKRLLPTLGLAAAVAGAGRLARSASLAAEEMGQLAQITGSSAENLSVFRFQAEQNRATLEEQRVGLVILAQNLQRLAQGNAAVTSSFAGVNLAAEDFVGLDTVEAAFRIADAIAAIESPARKTAVAKQLLGESGARLIPTLEELAEKGFAGATAEAEALGIVISDELARDVTDANQTMRTLGRQVEGLAIRFFAGLAPAVEQSMTTVQSELEGKGLDSMETFGKGVGFVLGAVINLFRLLATVVTAQLQIIGTSLAAVGAATVQALKLNFSEARSIMREGLADVAEIAETGIEQAARDIDKLVTDLVEGPPRKVDREVEVDPTLVGGGEEFDDAAAKARQKGREQAISDELAIVQAGLDAEQQANERAYDSGLTSLEQFHAERLRLLQAQSDAEIGALRARQAAVRAALEENPAATEADRLNALQQIGQLDSQIRTLQIQNAAALASAEDDRLSKAEELADRQRELANELDELEGNRHAVFQRNLEEEIAEVRELGRQAGQTAAEIAATVDRLSTNRTASFDFEEVRRNGQRALEAFTRDAELIRRDAEAGVISQLEGERRLITLQGERIGVLQELAAGAQAAAAATGSPESIAQAQAYADSIDQIALSYRAATDFGLQFKNAALDSFETGVANLLQNLDEIESLEDAFKSLAQTVAQSMAKIAAEILARQATLALLNSFGGGGGGFASFFGGGAAGAYRGGYLRGYAGGGDVRAPEIRSLPGPDKIPILGQKGEFMVRRAAVMQPGALDFLRQFNAGRISMRSLSARPRFATGGVVGGAAPVTDRAAGGAAQSDRFRIVNVVDPAMVESALSSPAGERVFLNVIDRNASKLRSKLLGG